MSLRVLRAGLDTVVVSYGGTIGEEIAGKLDGLKAVAQGTEDAQPIDLGLMRFLVQPTAFGFWRWRLVHPHLTIVARPKAASGGVLVQVRYSSFGLCNQDAASHKLQTMFALADLGTLFELCVSRADVCVDVQGWTPSVLEMTKNIVCPASYRATHGTEREVQTFQYGTKNLLRAYNKTAEIVKSKKDWLPELWGLNDAYDPDKSVWRVEYQATREVLKELGLDIAAALFADPGALLDYGLRWAQLRVPGEGVNKTRWPEDPRWTQIRRTTFGGIPLCRTVQPSSLMSLDRVKSNYLGAVATAGAYFGTTDYLRAAQMLSCAAEIQMKEDNTDFPDMVVARERRIMSGSD